LAGLLLAGRLSAQAPLSVWLDRFEYASIPIVAPEYGTLLWHEYNVGGTAGYGTQSTSTQTAFEGSRSLKVNVTSGNLYLMFDTHDGYRWQNMREFINGWTNDYYTRMRIWIKVPPAIQAWGSGDSNMNIGTYLRSSTVCCNAEDGGGHRYHGYDINYAQGNWEQLIIDPHPDHSRGANGDQEEGVVMYPTGEAKYNYFDALTWFYIDFQDDLPAPADFFVDGVELYRETRDENIDQVYSLHGVYIPQTNTVRVGWKRRKDQETIRHEVRYSFTDIFSTGWSAATPGGMVSAQAGGGYNGMGWSSSSISTSGRSTLYVGIKPENSAKFRQIAIPLTTGGLTSPAAPSNIRIIR